MRYNIRWRLPVLACLLLFATGCGGNSAEPSKRAQAVVWAVGDGANGSAQSRAVAARIDSGRPDRFLYLGDVYPSGTARDFAHRYEPVYGRLADVTAPTPGNHDWPRRRQGYEPYWRELRGEPQPPYYSFRLGGWQLLSLNSEAPHDRGSAQLRWLRGRLRQGGGNCRIAFWHSPRYSAGTLRGDQPDIAPLWDALRGRARIVVNAHEHNMQRLRPTDGITEFVSGAGGGGRYPLDRSDERLAFGDDTAYGALRLELLPGRARFAFVRQDGRVLDAGQLDRRP